MLNLRALAEKDLAITLEGDWGSDVTLIRPDGERVSTARDGRPLRGQVLYNTVRLNPETGERIVSNCPILSLRRSSLERVPTWGENWIIEMPVAPTVGAPTGQYSLSPARPPEGGESSGFVRLYLQLVEQEPAE